VGLGSLQLAFEQLKEKLRKEGLFDESRKKPLPLLPQKIGIVTSPTGAAIRDMLRVLARRNASLHVLIYPAKVQGEGAGREIAEGVRYLNSRPDIDVIIAGRGGGSIEDLWAFNEEIVARAIFESRIPVISAVGHEVDFTISDFVADLRAPTPSAAAEMVSGAREDLMATVQSFQGRLLQAMRLGIETRRVAHERLARSRAFYVAPNKIRDFQQSFDEATLLLNQVVRQRLARARQREQVVLTRLVKLNLSQGILRRREALANQCRGMVSAIRSNVDHAKSRLRLAAGKMDALSPLAILERGYAICRDKNGAVLRDSTNAAVGDSVSVKLSRGGIQCRVDRINRD